MCFKKQSLNKKSFIKAEKLQDQENLREDFKDPQTVLYPDRRAFYLRGMHSHFSLVAYAVIAFAIVVT